jgi:hypothetical protein
MGFRFRQKKTGAFLEIPVAGDLRRRIEAQIEHNRNRDVPVLPLLVNENTGRPWNQHTFCLRFAAARKHAIEQLDYAPLKKLQLRDLRRTAVVKMAELGVSVPEIAAITGHSLKTVDRILEIYMPRTTRMAANAMIARFQAPVGRPLERSIAPVPTVELTA